MPITMAVDRNTAPAAEKAHTLGTVASKGAALAMADWSCGRMHVDHTLLMWSYRWRTARLARTMQADNKIGIVTSRQG